MNIAFFLKPKQTVAYLYSDYTIRQSLEKMNRCGYTAIPVINREGKYVGTVSEGDFLRLFTSYICQGKNFSEKDMEEISLSKIIRQDCYKPVRFTADVEELINVAMNQNFIPVTDDSGSFSGIVTRKDIIKHLLGSSRVPVGEESRSEGTA